MATHDGAPMDEIQWRNEEAVVYFGGIRAENLHLYFLASPFCESSSNNKALENQLRYQPDSFHILTDRTAFEASLKNLNSGIEYLIIDGPKVTRDDINPVWTIRKQRRTKAIRPRDSNAPLLQDKVDILATYYAIGENIYQAVSIMDVLSNRLLTIENNIQKMFSTAASMQYFSPSQGHRYLEGDSSTTGKDGSSIRSSRGNTPAPDELQIPTPKSGQATSAPALDDASAREHNSLMRSLNMSMRFGGEYIDTNPLVGEPGLLSFTSTDSHLQAQAAAKAKAAAERLAKEANLTTSNLPNHMMETKSATFRKGAKAEKTVLGTQSKKRRRSKNPGSPDDE